MYWSLSLQFLLKKEKKKKRGMGYQIKIWTHEGPSIEKKEKKYMDT